MEYCGAGTYIKYIDGATKEEYYGYLETLKEKGYREFNSINAPIGICNATYRKESHFVTITHWPHRTVAIAYEDKQYPDEMQDICEAAEDFGNGNYVTKMENATLETYENCVHSLEEQGFSKYIATKTAVTFSKNDKVAHVSFVERTNTMYVTMGAKEHLSARLLPTKTDIVDVNAKTSLHLPELWTFGNSFVFQLKNGHFIIEDGGANCETPYLIDYLEQLCDGKPVIDGWFVSHGHVDHCGVLGEIAKVPAYAQRIYVEGIYYNEPNHCVVGLDPLTRREINFIKEATTVLVNQKGEHPKIYRPYLGQRYYFCDVMVDVIFTQEQLVCEKYYKGDFNDSSTWFMFHIEGQKILLGGDGGTGAMDFVVASYSKDEMKLDAFATLHHCLNTQDYFTDYCTVKTAIFTRASEPRRQIEENNHLKEVSEEWFSRENGPRVLTFPYKVGESVILPRFEWKYNVGEEKPFS